MSWDASDEDTFERWERDRRERRARQLLEDPNPVGAARWQLAHALGRLDAYRRHPDITPDLVALADELETALGHIRKAHDASAAGARGAGGGAVAGETEAPDSSGCEAAPFPDDDFIPQIPWSRD